jgi:hypothetical protein
MMATEITLRDFIGFQLGGRFCPPPHQGLECLEILRDVAMEGEQVLFTFGW